MPNFNSKIFNTRNVILFILLLFSVSIVLRLKPLMTQPLGKGFWNYKYQVWTNTEVFCHDIFVMLNYAKYPAKDHLYTSIGATDLHNKRNPELFVYTSFPSLFFIAPYLTARLLHLSPGHLFFQIFSLCIHLLCSILIYFMTIEFLGRPKTNSSVFLGLCAASVYIFSTNTLHNHMNTYWSHQFLQPFYIFAIFLIAKYRDKISYPWLIAISFFIPLITWTGYWISLAVALYYLGMKRKGFDVSWWKISIPCFVPFLAFGVNLLHVLTVLDPKQYFANLFLRASIRSSFTLSHYEQNTAQLFLQSLLSDYGFYFLLLLILIFSSRLIAKDKFYSLFKEKWSQVLMALVFLVPCFESALLIEHDYVYGFSRLKFIIPLILAISLFANLILESKPRIISYVCLLLLFTSAAYSHVRIYKQIHRSSYKEYTKSTELEQIEVELKKYWNYN